jgi:hypothetical protein
MTLMSPKKPNFIKPYKNETERTEENLSEEQRRYLQRERENYSQSGGRSCGAVSDPPRTIRPSFDAEPDRTQSSIRPICFYCQRPVERVVITRSHRLMALEIDFVCHGQRQRFILDDLVIYQSRLNNVFDMIPPPGS